MVRWLSVLIGLLSLGAGLALALCDPFSLASLAPRQESRFPERMWNADYFTNTPLVTHDGRELRFYDDLVKDKIVVVNFIYTSCRDVCSLATARLAEVRDMLGDRIGRDIFFYSITLDPLVDGPGVLAKYAANFHTGPGWLFLTGTPENIDSIRHKLGERTKSLGDHRNDVLLGNDATGEWGRDSIFSDVEHLAHNIVRMDPRERAAPTMMVSSTDTVGAPRAMGHVPGNALFAKACAACHRVGQGDHIGPDLAGMTERRSRDWLIRFITKPGKMIAEGDPTALELVARFGGLRMPELGLTPRDAEDLIAYVEITAGGSAKENIAGTADGSGVKKLNAR
ncbi:MAG: SCO family protein [Hyphomicrobium sp.]|uniref:SCO family protein n=1 Tax=Hyphomicrobium sp. TaxID=82 RepID=UPI003D109F03